MPAPQKNHQPHEGGQALSCQRGECGPSDALRRDRPPTEDKQGVEKDIQEHGPGDNQQGHGRLSDASHQSLKHGIQKHKDDPHERDPHKTERALIDNRRHAQPRSRCGESRKPAVPSTIDVRATIIIVWAAM